MRYAHKNDEIRKSTYKYKNLKQKYFREHQERDEHRFRKLF